MAVKTHFLAGKKIVVAGAGISGLSFVVGIRKLWDPEQERPEILMFDRDACEVSTGREGFSISLHEGLHALRDLGLLDEILDAAIVGSDLEEKVGRFCMWTSDWSTIMSLKAKPEKGLPTANLRIRRSDLRRILLNKVGETDNIQWGVSCVDVRQSEGGMMVVTTKTGEETRTVECDVVIAADGASSKMRRALRPDDGLNYVGVVQLAGMSRFEGDIPEPVRKNWGLALSGQGVALFCSPVDEHSVVWALSFMEAQRRESWKAGPETKANDAKVQAMTDEVKQRAQLYREPFRTILDATDPTTAMVLPARDKKPFRHDVVKESVVFIGDSNHAVSPFSGSGANMALRDGWDLAEKMAGSGTLAEAVGKYDDVSVPRAEKVLATSRDRIWIAHCTGWRFWLVKTVLMFAGNILHLLGK